MNALRRAIILSGMATGVLAAPALAHGEAVESVPAPGAVLAAPPAEIVLTLSSPVTAASTIQVLDSGFQAVEAGPMEVDPAVPGRIAVAVGALPPGDYTVQWTAVDAMDGHETQGSFVFEVQAGAPGAASGRGLWLGALALLVAGGVGIWLARRGRAKASLAAVMLVTLSTANLAACQAPDNGPAAPDGSRVAPAATLAGGADGTPDTGFAQMATAEAGSPPSQAVIVSTDLAAGHQRFAFALLDANNAMVQNADATVTFFRIEGDTATPTGTSPATFYPSALEPAGTYVVYTEFAGAGVWGAEINATPPDGQAAAPIRVRFPVAQVSAAPAVGDIPPPQPNRTLATEPDLAKLTSDPQPDPELYRLTVDEARASGKPTVVVFATPGFCQSKVCGPVLDEIKALRSTWGDRVNFIHVEVYQSFDPLAYADAMAAWGLATEPWVFVLDKDGRVAERLEGSATAAEIEPILARVTE